MGVAVEGRVSGIGVAPLTGPGFMGEPAAGVALSPRDTTGLSGPGDGEGEGPTRVREEEGGRRGVELGGRDVEST